MVLIADGGSTKCDWVLLDSAGNQLLKTRTLGLNPVVVPQEELAARIKENENLRHIFKNVKVLDFYGAGCGTQVQKHILQKVFTPLFPNALITIEEDLVAAALAVTNKPGIVCIFGTGSNSCYFDGKNIKTNAPSLGFILMDEASGNYFGKRLIRDYFYKKMPLLVALEFEKQFDLDPDVLKNNLYKKPNPNTYLASFAEFIFTQEKLNDYFYNLIHEGVLKFVKDRVLTFKEAHSLPIHFIGSIAYYSKNIIKDCLNQYHLELGEIVQRPIDGLIVHYKKNKLNL